MPNPKGNPENLQPFKPDKDQPMTESLSFRVTRSMKDEVSKKENPPEFCRQAIQKALDEDKSTSEE